MAERKPYFVPDPEFEVHFSAGYRAAVEALAPGFKAAQATGTKVAQRAFFHGALNALLTAPELKESTRPRRASDA